MDTITKTKQANSGFEEIRFNDLVSEKDIANMSNENIDSIFDVVYKHIMKDAVYPHLSGIRVSCKC